MYNKRSTDMQSSCWGQIDVDSQLVTELLQLIHHFGFGWRVAPEQRQLREFLVDVVCCGDVSQQHELLHQPGEQCEVVKQCRLTAFLFHLFVSREGFFLFIFKHLIWEQWLLTCYYLCTGKHSSPEASWSLCPEWKTVSTENNQTNKTKPSSDKAWSCFCTIYCLIIENYWGLYRDKQLLLTWSSRSAPPEKRWARRFLAMECRLSTAWWISSMGCSGSTGGNSSAENIFSGASIMLCAWS